MSVVYVVEFELFGIGSGVCLNSLLLAVKFEFSVIGSRV